MVRFFVQFTNGQTVYYSGQTLSGSIVLELSGPWPVLSRSVCLGIHGEAYAIKKECKTRYYDYVCYLNRVLKLWSAPPGQESLPAGIHRFPFSFKLPDRLPRSFEHDANTYGGLLAVERSYIRYWVVASVDRPSHSDITCKVPFTILEYININDACLLHSMTSENEKQLCCCCCTSGPLFLSASVDRMGYCPGETVTISASAENHSSRQLVGLQARLVAVTTVLSPTNGLATRNKVTVTRLGTGRAIPPRGSDSWSNAKLEIPALPPTIDSCRMLTRDYYVQVEIAVARGFDLETYFPIIIGSVPFRESSQVNDVVTIDSTDIDGCGYPPPLTVPRSATTVPAAVPQFTVSNQVINVAANGDQSALNYTPVYPYAHNARKAPTAIATRGDPPEYEEGKEDQPLL
ncbi:arrestin domain-containing protein 3-like [Corticium candelabrum]|uniref:arrestin domain-containing protein 3-like n=1 Tax=Corticium candelabrum TaxID=121492 RepID=UPI002E25CA02|nr:arrestin domain-containing protein 3-like [Corticium candelabrum]